MLGEIKIGKTADGGYKYSIHVGARVWESEVEQDTYQDALTWGRIARRRILDELRLKMAGKGL